MPQPSLSTKPSREALNGREARVGSSLRVLRAREEQNPPMPSGETVDSVPPAIITSAVPWTMVRKASPIEWAPVEQAETWLRFGPLQP